MRGYIAIPSNARMVKYGDKSLHFDTKEKMLKAFGLTEARLDYLLASGAQAYRGYFSMKRFPPGVAVKAISNDRMGL